MSGLKDYLVRLEPVGEGSPLSSFAGELMKHGAVPVGRDGGSNGPLIGQQGSPLRLAGLVHADLVADRQHPKEAKARGMVSRTSVVMMDTSVEEATARLVEERVRALPVQDGDRVVGLITERSLVGLPEIRDDRRPVDQLASVPVTVAEDASLGHARALMREKRIGRLPVVDASGRLVGLLEWSHLVMVEYRHDREHRLIATEPVPESRLQVTVAMDSKPLTVGTKDPVGDVAKRMKEMDRSSAVLVEDGKPVGIVTCEDLLEPVAARFTREAEGIHVQMTGLDGVDAFDRSTVDRLVKENLQRFIHAVKDPEFLYLHVKTYKEDGSRQKFSIRARLADGKGTLNARSHSYDLAEAVDEALQRLGRVVQEQRDVRREQQRSDNQREARKFS
jgi:CBS domain-containing protein/ribosome-associated translation inhibitor RaiA